MSSGSQAGIRNRFRAVSSGRYTRSPSPPTSTPWNSSSGSCRSRSTATTLSQRWFTLTNWPIASPFGNSDRAAVSPRTATCANRSLSSSPNSSPAVALKRVSSKYDGLTAQTWAWLWPWRENRFQVRTGRTPAQSATKGRVSRSALASAIDNPAECLRASLRSSPGGSVASTIRLSTPMPSIIVSASRRPPSLTASMAMTAPTPNTMPSRVSAERSRWWANWAMAWRMSGSQWRADCRTCLASALSDIWRGGDVDRCGARTHASAPKPGPVPRWYRLRLRPSHTG